MLKKNVKDVVADSIEQTTEVMSKLKKEITNGSPTASMYETFATLARTLNEQCYSLHEFEQRAKK